MSEFLIIHYKPGSQSNLQFWAMGADLHPSVSLGQGDFEELKIIARGKKVTLLIDAHYTSQELVDIPSKSRSKQILAVPFAMEDCLAEDIDDMHFTLGKSSSDASSESHVPVIAIKRSLLQQTLDLFKQHQIHIDAITADSVALTSTPNQWAILLDQDNAIIKTGNALAHTCDRENLAIILQALISSLPETEEKPDSISFHFKEDDDEAATLLSDIDTDIKIEARCYANHSLEIFVRHLKNISAFNLLQGEFTPKRDENMWLKPWKAAAIAASVLLALQLSYDSILATQLETKNLALTKKIETEFKKAMPGVKKMTNMQKRVKRRLSDLKSGGSGSSNSSFLQILSKVAPALSEGNKVTIKATVYKNNYIDVDLTAKTLQDMEDVKSKLAAIPGIKTVLSTTVKKDSVKGRLRLEAKG